MFHMEIQTAQKHIVANVETIIFIVAGLVANVETILYTLGHVWSNIDY